MITHQHPVWEKSINSYQFIKEKQFTAENEEELHRKSHKAQLQYSDFSEATYALLSKQKEVTLISTGRARNARDSGLGSSELRVQTRLCWPLKMITSLGPDG